MSNRAWFAVSAREWIDSESIELDAVITNATNLRIAIPRLAANAAIMARFDSSLVDNAAARHRFDIEGPVQLGACEQLALEHDLANCSTGAQ